MQFDVSIIGGGLVGSSLALSLADAGYKVQLLDAKPPVTSLPEHLDLRVVALAKASLDWLQTIKVFPLLARERLGQFQKVSVCEDNIHDTLDFEADTVALDYLGLIVENQHIIYAMHQRVLSHPNIEAHFSNTLKTIDELSARLIIGADGANSWLRNQLGLTVQNKDYKQRALVAFLELEKPHKFTAWQRFLETGPIAFLPMHNPRNCSMVWTLPSEQALACQNKTSFDLSEAITQASNNAFGKVKLASDVASFPLRLQHAHEYGRNGCILLGDAIHSIHPLAGQGVNLGFADAQALFNLLRKTDVKHWHKDLLRQQFERSRRTHNTIIAHSMSAFLNTRLRHSGISVFKRSTKLKKMAMQVALG